MTETPASAAAQTYDAIILGGGLAGLTLALQLKGEFPDMNILVLERHAHPLPVAAHKVGESTVEIGAHYFEHTLGLREHLITQQLRKFGLRYFFSEGRSDIDQVIEVGVTRFLPLPSYQIDRGVFETFLGEEALRRGIDFRHGCKVADFDVGKNDALHQVRFVQNGEKRTAAARWLLDASGRAGLLRRRFNLTADNGHKANAVWFRINERIEIDNFVADPAWRAQCEPPSRWLSTNHMMGPGYWAWLIPLGSGAHSIGIVTDAIMHPLDEIRDFDKAMLWLHKHQPALAEALEPHRDKLMDFRFLREYSYSSSQLFSADRWALAGEAGTFIDPFYSPGSDFIAIANTYITSLIGLDRAGQPLAPFARIYQELFFSLYDNTLTLFRGQYPLFGNAAVMPHKITWDYTYYWGVMCQLVFQRRLTDMDLLRDIGSDLQRAARLNQRMQRMFNDWHAVDDGTSSNTPGMRDQGAMDWFAALNTGLADDLDSAQLRQRLHANVDLLEGLADAMTERAARSDPSLAAPPSGHPQPMLFDAAQAREQYR